MIAVDQQMSPGKGPSDAQGNPVKSVTLILSVKEAAAIQLASEVSRVRMLLRGSGDVGSAAGAEITLAELVSGVEADAEPAAPSTRPARRCRSQEPPADRPPAPCRSSVEVRKA